MIPLRLRIDIAAGPHDVFVARLNSVRPKALEPEDVVLAAEGPRLEYRSETCCILVEGGKPDELDGNVLLVNPHRRTAQRLIRPQSSHNTFLVTERCDQLCVMCSQPPKASEWNHFSLFTRAAILAPQGAVIGISGGEPTLLKDDLFRFLDAVSSARPDLGFHVLTNAQHFDGSDHALLRGVAERVEWGIPIYSHDPAIHDRVVGKEGAFARLEESLALLGAAGARIELRTVLTSLNHQALPWLARYVTSHVPFAETWAIMQMESIGFGRMNWKALFVDTSSDFAPVARALSIVAIRGLTPRLYNFPLCTIPAGFRPYAVASISDWKQKFLPVCSSCSARKTCGGFFEWYPNDHGYTGVIAI